MGEPPVISGPNAWITLISEPIALMVTLGCVRKIREKQNSAPFSFPHSAPTRDSSFEI
jgi:hypothetical protein